MNIRDYLAELNRRAEVLYEIDGGDDYGRGQRDGAISVWELVIAELKEMFPNE